MLDDALPPHVLYWLVHVETPLMEPEDVQNTLGFLERCLVEHMSLTATFLREVLTVYAAWLLKSQPSEPSGELYPIPQTMMMASTSPNLSPADLARLSKEVVHCASPRPDAYRLIMYMLCEKTAATREMGVLPNHTFSNAQKHALKTMIQKYAPECTFKTNGDFSIHAELMLMRLPAWLSCSLVHNEMPYPLMVKAYPATVNNEVRPLLDKSLIDRVSQINWDDVPCNPSDLVVIYCLITEMLSSKKIKLLVNADGLRDLSLTWPLPYMWKLNSGVVEMGVRDNGTFLRASLHKSVLEHVLTWLEVCRQRECQFTANVHSAALDPDHLDSRNPMGKYLL